MSTAALPGAKREAQSPVTARAGCSSQSRPLHIFAIGTTIHSMALWTIRAEYDPEAAVWWTADSDIPGLATDAPTLEQLAAKVGALLPDLLELHADQLADVSRRSGPIASGSSPITNACSTSLPEWFKAMLSS